MFQVDGEISVMAESMHLAGGNEGLPYMTEEWQDGVVCDDLVVWIHVIVTETRDNGRIWKCIKHPVSDKLIETLDLSPRPALPFIPVMSRNIQFRITCITSI